MSRLTRSLVAAAVLGQLIGPLGYLEVLFIPLVLAAPVVTGAIASSRRIAYAWIAVLWASAGLNMAWMDWVIYQEDVVFHLALAVFMPLLAGIGWGAVRLTGRRLIRA